MYYDSRKKVDSPWGNINNTILLYNLNISSVVQCAVSLKRFSSFRRHMLKKRTTVLCCSVASCTLHRIRKDTSVVDHC